MKNAKIIHQDKKTCIKTLKNCLPKYLFVSVLGVLLHFTYEWSGNNPVVGLFSAINESTWEHLKLLFFPMLFLTLGESFRSQDDTVPSLPARTIGIIAGMICIVVTFYTLSGVFGQLPGFINIVIYFIAVAFAFLTEQHFINNSGKLTRNIFGAILLIFISLFFVFTFFPPNIGLFVSPVVIFVGI